MDWLVVFANFRRRIALMVAVLALGLGAVAYVLTVKDIVSLGLPSWAWLAIGFIVFGVAVLAVVVQFVHDVEERMKAVEPQRNVPESASNLPSPSAAPPLSGVEFWPDRAARDYMAMIKSAENVWVLWNTGANLKGQHQLPELFPHIARILLPYPDCGLNPGLEAMALACESTEHLTEEGKQRTRHFIAQGILDVSEDVLAYNQHVERKIELRWRIGHSGAILAGCADWVFSEQFLPFLKAKDRPSYRVHRVQCPLGYRSLRESFETIWGLASPVTDEMLRALRRADSQPQRV